MADGREIVTKGKLLLANNVSNCVFVEMYFLSTQDQILNKLLYGNLHWLIVEKKLPVKRSIDSGPYSSDQLELLYNQRLRALDVMPYTNVVLAFLNVSDSWELFELYKAYRKARLSVVNIASNYLPAVDRYGSQLIVRRKLVDRRRNLQGFAMPCGTAVRPHCYLT